MSQALHDTLDSKLTSLNLLAMRGVYLNLSENMTKEQLGHIDYLEELRHCKTITCNFARV